jgi:fructose/tagatose bisphosphate aldolase
MVRPIVQTLKERGTFALLEVARPDIQRFGAVSYEAVARAFEQYADRGFVRLHQDHVPVVDEEQREVAWEPLIRQALDLGYDSVMLDGSRLPLKENIAATRAVVELAHPGVAVEGELGAVLGHEVGQLPPYEELFSSGRGFTNEKDASRFVRETGVDWLSVAAGNIHGAIAGAAKDKAKFRARLNVEHLGRISSRVGVPLVLHGGTSIELGCVLEAARNGITKINIGTAVRQPYEACLRAGGSEQEAQAALARAVAEHIEDYGIVGSASKLAAG